MNFKHTLTDIFYDLGSAIFSWLDDGRNHLKQNSGHQGKLASSHSVLRRSHHGFCLTGKRSLSRQLSFTNALIIGGTGSGKSSRVLIPSLLKMKGNFVVHDPSGELYQKTAGYLQSKGYVLKVLNFAAPEQSERYNPLERVKTSSQIGKVATLLIRSALGAQATDPFWNLQGVHLLSLLITLAKLHQGTQATLSYVRRLLTQLESHPTGIESLLKQTKRDDLLAEYQAFQAFDQKVRGGIIATCLASIQLFTDEAVCRVTDSDSINLGDIRKQKTALFVQNPIQDQAYYAPLTAIFLEQLFGVILNQLPRQSEQDLFFLIDESSSLYIPGLPTFIVNCRKYRCGTLLALQDYQQLVARYGSGNAQTIKSNCLSKLYFTNQSLATATELEQLIGKVEQIDTAGRNVVKPILTRDSIRALDPQFGLLLCSYHRPMLIRLHPYFKQRRLRKRSSLAAPLLSHYETPTS